MKPTPLRPQHPSGRPVRLERHLKRPDPIWRIPALEPVVPRLRKQEPRGGPADAIGFHPVRESDSEIWTWAKRK